MSELLTQRASHTVYARALATSHTSSALEPRRAPMRPGPGARTAMRHERLRILRPPTAPHAKHGATAKTGAAPQQVNSELTGAGDA